MIRRGENTALKITKQVPLIIGFTLIFAIGAVGCGKTSVPATEAVVSWALVDGETTEIPEFSASDGGEITSEMERLNKETKVVKDFYEETKSNGTKATIKTSVTDNGRFITTDTVYSRPALETDDGFNAAGNNENIMTLVYDYKNDRAVMCKDALEILGIAGDQLSIDVNNAYVNAGFHGTITYTDMQGFVPAVSENDGTSAGSSDKKEIDTDVSIEAVYMKLRIKEDDTEMEQFFRYDPSDMTIEKIDPESVIVYGIE
jgi:hypothetical protein